MWIRPLRNAKTITSVLNASQFQGAPSIVEVEVTTHTSVATARRSDGILASLKGKVSRVACKASYPSARRKHNYLFERLSEFRIQRTYHIRM